MSCVEWVESGTYNVNNSFPLVEAFAICILQR